jgi:hypothetical protein
VERAQDLLPGPSPFRNLDLGIELLEDLSD